MSQGPPVTFVTLRDKYLELLRLRRAAEEVGARGLAAPPAALAARFPGALRQLDRLPFDVIVARLGELEAAEEGEVPWPRWGRWEETYHDRLRATLRVKRVISGAMSDDEAMAVAARAWSHGADDSPSPREPFSRARLELIRRPSGGRLSASVLDEVAREVGATVDELREVLFAPVSCGDGGG